jgi:hypothetical protein
MKFLSFTSKLPFGINSLKSSSTSRFWKSPTLCEQSNLYEKLRIGDRTEAIELIRTIRNDNGTDVPAAPKRERGYFRYR